MGVTTAKRRKTRPPVDGGRRVNTDAAPKTIRCRRITAFSCAFSTMAYLDAPEVPPAGVYRMEATRTGKTVRVRFGFRRHDGSGNEQIVTADTAFLDELAKIVREGGLARFNGIHTTVEGLPDLYGAELSVRYASGESISAGDNQDCFLPSATMTALAEIFSRQTGDPTRRQEKGVLLWD